MAQQDAQAGSLWHHSQLLDLDLKNLIAIKYCNVSKGSWLYSSGELHPLGTQPRYILNLPEKLARGKSIETETYTLTFTYLVIFGQGSLSLVGFLALQANSTFPSRNVHGNKHSSLFALSLLTMRKKSFIRLAPDGH